MYGKLGSALGYILTFELSSYNSDPGRYQHIYHQDYRMIQYFTRRKSSLYVQQIKGHHDIKLN